MIFGNKNFISSYNFLPEKILKCFKFAEINNLSTYEKGSYEIDGKEIFVNIVEYETTERSNRFWEAHKHYIDLHLMLLGNEIIDINFIKNMEQNEYVENEDFLPLNGQRNSYTMLSNDDFLICYPEDAHMTAICNETPEKVKKAIFKIRME